MVDELLAPVALAVSLVLAALVADTLATEKVVPAVLPEDGAVPVVALDFV